MPRKNALISVIVPIYNTSKFLSLCLSSIIRQDYQNLEIILVNDGSTDNSLEIATSFAQKDDRINIINKKNSGVSHSRNKALDIAHGEYICFVDSDDCLDVNHISYLYNLIQKYNSSAATVPRFYKFTSKQSLDNIVDPKKAEEVWSGRKATIQMLYYNITISSCGKLIKKEILDQNKIRFDEKLRCGEGFNFCIEAFEKIDKVAIGYKPIYFYRLDNPTSAMTKFNMKFLKNGIEAIERIKKILTPLTDDVLKAYKYAHWHTYCDFLNTIVGSNNIKNYPEEYKKLKKISRKEALCTLNSPIPIKDKIKGILYFLNPYLAVIFINYFRKREFTNEEE